MPTIVTEGDTVSVELRATNASYQMLGGVKTPVAVDLIVAVNAKVDSTQLIPLAQKVIHFGPGENITINVSTWGVLQFAIPLGAGGKSGFVYGQLLDPSGTALASGQVSFPIAIAPIVYGGSIVFTSEGFDPWIYDTDGDGYISLSEVLVAINDYNAGKITLEMKDAVTLLWKNNTRR